MSTYNLDLSISSSGALSSSITSTTNITASINQIVSGSGGGGSGDMTKSVYDITSNGIVDNSEKLNAQSAPYYLDRTNHTGTQLAATISNFNATADARITSTAVESALNGATLGDVTVGGIDKVLIQDFDDNYNLATVTTRSIAGLAGGGGLYFPYIFDGTTTFPTNSNRVRFNNATFASVTQINVHYNNNQINATQSLLARILVGATLQFSSAAIDRFSYFAVTSVTDNPGSSTYTYGVTPLVSNGMFGTNENIYMGYGNS